jgi:TolB-like protein
MSQQIKNGQGFWLKKLLYWSALACLPLAGCLKGYSITGGPGPLVSPPLSVSHSFELPRAALKSIAVLPLQNSLSTQLSEEELEQFTEALLQELQAQTSLSLLNLSEPEPVKVAIRESLSMREPDLSQAINLGRKLKVRGVLFGSITRFAPLAGGSAPQSPIRFSGSIDDTDFNTPGQALRGGVAPSGRTLPGGVGFALSLVDTNSGAILWSASFDVKERAVAENLFQLKQQLEFAGNRPELGRILRLGFRSAAQDLESAKTVR